MCGRHSTPPIDVVFIIAYTCLLAREGLKRLGNLARKIVSVMEIYSPVIVDRGAGLTKA